MNEASVRKPHSVILCLLASFGSVSAVLFTPALPAIQAFFQLSISQTQLAITIYLLGYALGQLPYGPLSNCLGRKKALVVGISLAIVGSSLCVVSSFLPSFSLLLLARFFQALGAACGLKISFTMIADMYSQTEATKLISRVLLAFAIMPGIAVATGGWLVHFFGWESCFYFLSAFGLLVLGLSAFLPETAKALDPSALHLASIFRGYRAKFKNSQLVFSAFILGLTSTVVYLFASQAPFVGIQVIGLSPPLFGTYNLIPLIGMALGSLGTGKLAERFSFSTIVPAGLATAFGCACLMSVFFFLGKVTPLTLFFPVFFIYFAQSFVFANIASFGLAHAKDKSNGSAVLHFINLGTAVVGVLMAEVVSPETTLLLPVAFIAIFSVALLLWFLLRRAGK